MSYDNSMNDNLQYLKKMRNYYKAELDKLYDQLLNVHIENSIMEGFLCTASVIISNKDDDKLQLNVDLERIRQDCINCRTARIMKYLSFREIMAQYQLKLLSRIQQMRKLDGMMLVKRIEYQSMIQCCRQLSVLDDTASISASIEEETDTNNQSQGMYAYTICIGIFFSPLLAWILCVTKF